jgi:hypothetical protein
MRVLRSRRIYATEKSQLIPHAEHCIEAPRLAKKRKLYHLSSVYSNDACRSG